MTFEEYVNQTEAKKLNIGEVKLKPHDIRNITSWVFSDRDKKYYRKVTLYYNGLINYVQYSDSRILYTENDKPSVFSFNDLR